MSFQLTFLKTCYLIPALWLTVFWSFVLRAWVTLGHWPTYNNPDPKLLRFSIHFNLIYFLMFFVPGAYFYIVYAKANLMKLDQQISRRLRLTIWLSGLGLLLTVGTVFGRSGLSWFLD